MKISLDNDEKQMRKLGLLEEFKNFRSGQAIRNRDEVLKHERTFIGSMTTAMTTALGGAALMAGGALSVPIIIVGSIVGAGSIAVAAYAKHKSNDISHNGSDKLSANAFIELIDVQNRSFGNKHYEKFVAETLEDSPELASRLSDVSATFNQKASMPGLQPRIPDVSPTINNDRLETTPNPDLYSSEQAQAARIMSELFKEPKPAQERTHERVSGNDLSM